MGWWDDVLDWKARIDRDPVEEIKKILLKEDEEENMSRKKLVVEFKKTDGPTPGRSEQAGRPFLLKLPMSITLPPGATRVMKMGLSCNLPAIVCRRGETTIFAPGQELEVTLRNNEVNPLVLGEKEVVAQCFVLDNTDLETVDA